jgi:Protein of unknown function, DUF547
MRNCFLFVILLFVPKTFIAQPVIFDHSLFTEVLRSSVNENGLVDYQNIRANKNFYKYLIKISNADISNLDENEKLAFYINAYNASVIKNVIDNLPISSPMDVEGFFKKKKFICAGEELTLDEIENQKVLKINSVLPHFGLVCAAKSCPKLLDHAYDGKSVLKQLEENAKKYLNDTSQNRLDKENKVLYLSELFKWFKKYFEAEYGSLINTIKEFANESDKIFLEDNEVEIRFLPYNWKLNTQ